MSQYFDNKDSFLQPKVNQYGNHMVMTNVHKPSKTKYCNIDTRFRDDYDNYSQIVSGSPIQWFTFTLPETINNVKSICVTHVELPMSFYNISASLGNNVMEINDNLIILPDGTYDNISLKSAIQLKLNSISLSSVIFDLSYNGNYTASFRNTSGSPLNINFAIKPTTLCNGTIGSNATAEFDKFDIKSKLGWFLGFRNISYTIANNTIKYAENVLDLNNPKYVYLALDEFSNGNQTSFISPMPMSIVNKNILSRISLDFVQYGIGTVMPANNYNGYLLSDRRTYNGKVNLQKIKLQLVNEYGRPIHLNGLDFSFCLEIEYE